MSQRGSCSIRKAISTLLAAFFACAIDGSSKIMVMGFRPGSEQCAKGWYQCATRDTGGDIDDLMFFQAVTELAVSETLATDEKIKNHLANSQLHHVRGTTFIEKPAKYTFTADDTIKCHAKDKFQAKLPRSDGTHADWECELIDARRVFPSGQYNCELDKERDDFKQFEDDTEPTAAYGVVSSFELAQLYIVFNSMIPNHQGLLLGALVKSEIDLSEPLSNIAVEAHSKSGGVKETLDVKVEKETDGDKKLATKRKVSGQDQRVPHQVDHVVFFRASDQNEGRFELKVEMASGDTGLPSFLGAKCKLVNQPEDEAKENKKKFPWYVWLIIALCAVL